MGTRVITLNILIFLQVTFLHFIFNQNFASAEETVYTTLSSPQVYSNSEYKIHVFLQPSLSDSSTITFLAKLDCENSSFSSGTITLVKLTSGRTGEIVIPTGTIRGSSCDLTVHQEENGVTAPPQYTTVNVGKNDFIFLQTDKPIYKPREFVLFRVLLMDRHSMPKPSRIDVRVFDSQRNLIKLWFNVDTDEFGLFEGQFELSYQPNMGEWTIEVKTLESAKLGKPTTKKLGFKVDEYVLPTFDVDVELPKFRIISAMETIPIKIQAKYLYGEGVKGECTIVVTLSTMYCGTETRRLLETFSVKIAGSASQDLNLTTHIGNDTNNKAHLEFHVTVKEHGTGRTAIEQKVMVLYKNPFKIRPDVKVTYSRPGLSFPIDFKILDNDDQIVKINGENASIEHNLNGEGENFQEPIREGIIHLRMTYNNFESTIYVKVTYKDISYAYYVPERLESEYQNYLIIEASTSKLSPRSVLNIVGETTNPIVSLNVAMVSDGEVILANVTTFPESLPKFSIDVTIPSNIKSNAKLFVFTYIDDEYVGDFVELKIIQDNTQQESNLQISLSKQRVSPGELVGIHITSRENSIVALRGVDEAISLLTSRDDLTLQDLTNEFQSEKKMTQEGAEGFFELNNSEMLILTNSEQKPEGYVSESDFEPDDEICSVSMSFSSPERKVIRTASEKFRPRSYFPETWLWRIVTVGPNTSRNNLQIKVPDTLTSWVISGYSLKPNSQIQFLPAPLKLTTFKEFFISLELPYSVVQSEALQLIILIHNYIPGNVSSKVNISMYNPNNEYEVEGFGPSAKIIRPTPINCEPNSVTPVQLELTPLKHGNLELLFDATSGNVKDALLQILRVIPRGQKEIQSRSAVMTAQKWSYTQKDLEVKLSNIVPGSDTVKISISADIMSSSTENIESLIELPVGCGEQNMLTFGTDIVTLNYLKATRRLTSEIQKKGVRFLELGHQRQLTFRNSDGSFSAFAQSDTTGSTWLTAYVIRYFLLAKAYITIDDQVISEGLEFLKSQQMADGRFQERGRVIDPVMVGEGKFEGVALTGFCLLTFLEARRQRFNNETEVIDKGRCFNLKILNSRTPTQDIYAFALATYVELEWDKEMSISTHCSYYYNNNNNYYYYFLNSQQIVTYDDDTSQDLMYWRQNRGQSQNNSERIKPIDIETTGYALLVYLLRSPPGNSFPIVKWLLQRQNPNGGFLSTQDTLVALTAMAKYAELTQVGNTNLDVRVIWFLHNAGYWSPDNYFKINETNANYLNEYLVSGGAHTVGLDVIGTGTLYAKAVWTYYVETDLQERDFFLNITKRETGSWYFFLNVCTKLRRGRHTNMVILQARVPSGYVVDTFGLYASLAKVKNYRYYELHWKGTEINIYFDYIPTHQDTCVRIGVSKLYHVRNPARSFVKIYDYYDPYKMSLEYYDPPEVRSFYQGK